MALTSDLHHSDTDALPGDLRIGNLEVRLARDESELRAAQALRYRVFYEEMQKEPPAVVRAEERDFDAFDPVCDHLVVVDHNKTGAEAIVATYRMLRRSKVVPELGFYSAPEYDLTLLMDWPGEIVEMGRSCVDAAYRTRSAMQLLWRGIAAYVFKHDIELLFGCASFTGTDIQSYTLPLSYLYHYHLAPPALRARAVKDRFEQMNNMSSHDINQRDAINALPPLIKGYLRLGGMVGDGAVIDYDFSSIDVFIIVKTDQITEKYFKHYERVSQDDKE